MMHAGQEVGLRNRSKSNAGGACREERRRTIAGERVDGSGEVINLCCGGAPPEIRAVQGVDTTHLCNPRVPKPVRHPPIVDQRSTVKMRKPVSSAVGSLPPETESPWSPGPAVRSEP